jgi:hypothetical protein
VARRKGVRSDAAARWKAHFAEADLNLPFLLFPAGDWPSKFAEGPSLLNRMPTPQDFEHHGMAGGGAAGGMPGGMGGGMAIGMGGGMAGGMGGGMAGGMGPVVDPEQAMAMEDMVKYMESSLSPEQEMAMAQSLMREAVKDTSLRGSKYYSGSIQPKSAVGLGAMDKSNNMAPAMTSKSMAWLWGG